MKIVKKSFENLTKLKYFEAILRTKNYIHKAFQSRLNSGVTCNRSFRVFYLSGFCLKIETENVVFNYSLMWCETLSPIRREGQLRKPIVPKLGKLAGGWLMHNK
jgi:hypothetical protein